MELTPSAAEELRRLLRQRAAGEEAGVLISVQGGGCQGLTYLLDVLATPRPGFEVAEVTGLRLFTDPRTVGHLAGLVIDYVQDELNRGFVFRNPSARATCGCGSSFST